MLDKFKHKMVRVVDNVTITIKYRDSDMSFAGKRNIYHVSVKNNDTKRTFTFTFYDSPLKTREEGLFHSQLLEYVLNTIVKEVYQYGNPKHRTNKVVSHEWVEGVKVYLKMTFL